MRNSKTGELTVLDRATGWHIPADGVYEAGSGMMRGKFWHPDHGVKIGRLGTDRNGSFVQVDGVLKGANQTIRYYGNGRVGLVTKHADGSNSISPPMDGVAANLTTPDGERRFGILRQDTDKEVYVSLNDRVAVKENGGHWTNAIEDGQISRLDEQLVVLDESVGQAHLPGGGVKQKMPNGAYNNAWIGDRSTVYNGRNSIEIDRQGGSTRVVYDGTDAHVLHTSGRSQTIPEAELRQFKGSESLIDISGGVGLLFKDSPNVARLYKPDGSQGYAIRADGNNWVEVEAQNKQEALELVVGESVPPARVEVLQDKPSQQDNSVKPSTAELKLVGFFQPRGGEYDFRGEKYKYDPVIQEQDRGILESKVVELRAGQAIKVGQQSTVFRSEDGNLFFETQSEYAGLKIDGERVDAREPVRLPRGSQIELIEDIGLGEQTLVGFEARTRQETHYLDSSTIRPTPEVTGRELDELLKALEVDQAVRTNFGRFEKTSQGIRFTATTDVRVANSTNEMFDFEILKPGQSTILTTSKELVFTTFSEARGSVAARDVAAGIRLGETPPAKGIFTVDEAIDPNAEVAIDLSNSSLKFGDSITFDDELDDLLMRAINGEFDSDEFRLDSHVSYGDTGFMMNAQTRNLASGSDFLRLELAVKEQLVEGLMRTQGISRVDTFDILENKGIQAKFYAGQMADLDNIDTDNLSVDSNGLIHLREGGSARIVGRVVNSDGGQVGPHSITRPDLNMSMDFNLNYEGDALPKPLTGSLSSRVADIMDRLESRNISSGNQALFDKTLGEKPFSLSPCTPHKDGSTGVLEVGTYELALRIDIRNKLEQAGLLKDFPGSDLRAVRFQRLDGDERLYQAVIENVPGTTLDKAVEELNLTSSELDSIRDQLIDQQAKLIKAGLYNDDVKGPNIVVRRAPNGEVVAQMIDMQFPMEGLGEIFSPNASRTEKMIVGMEHIDRVINQYRQ